MCKLVAYYRVSTAKQGLSGLGLEAQRQAVHDYSKVTGREVVEEFLEVESGNEANRPRLQAALELCELTGARLVIAKLDRLARNVSFISNLMESGAKFTAVDMPEANELTSHIMAAMAEHERKMISQRTKAALKAAKARGVVLGNPNLAEARAARSARDVTKAATEARVAASNDRAIKVYKAISAARSNGARSLQELADYLNTKTIIRTPRGARWTKTAVARVVRRAEASVSTPYTVEPG